MEPKELLKQMMKPEQTEPEWLNDRKIEVADIAKALQCSPQVLYTFAKEGKCPFISAAKAENNKNTTYLVWPGLAELYIGKDRLRNAVDGRETA